MTYAEEINLVLDSIRGYANQHELSANDILNIFNHGTLHLTYPLLKSPFVDANKSKAVKPLTLPQLKDKLTELQDTQKYLPSCEVQKHDKLLDQITEITKLIRTYGNSKSA